MVDSRLERADATKLDELREMLARQENADGLRPIEMDQIYISHGAIKQINQAVRSLTENRKVLMVTGPAEILSRGENVKEQILTLLKQDFEVEWLMLEEENGGLIHATPENSEKIESRLDGVGCVVGVGSGTICDLCKRATFAFNEEQPLPLLFIQTALSVNAFSDGVSVMLINGVKRTIHSRYPSVLIVDLDIVADAPPEMNISG